MRITGSMSSVASRGGWKRCIYVQEIAMFSSVRTMLKWKKNLSALKHILLSYLMQRFLNTLGIKQYYKCAFNGLNYQTYNTIK